MRSRTRSSSSSFDWRSASSTRRALADLRGQFGVGLTQLIVGLLEAGLPGDLVLQHQGRILKEGGQVPIESADTEGEIFHLEGAEELRPHQEREDPGIGIGELRRQHLRVGEGVLILERLTAVEDALDQGVLDPLQLRPLPAHIGIEELVVEAVVENDVRGPDHVDNELQHAVDRALQPLRGADPVHQADEKLKIRLVLGQALGALLQPRQLRARNRHHVFHHPRLPSSVSACSNARSRCSRETSRQRTGSPTRRPAASAASRKSPEQGVRSASRYWRSP